MLDIEAGNSSCILRRLLLLEVEVCRHSHHGILDLAALSAVGLCDLLHLLQEHGRYLLRVVPGRFAIHLDNEGRLAVLALFNLERPQRLVPLDSLLVEAASNQSFGVK